MFHAFSTPVKYFVSGAEIIFRLWCENVLFLCRIETKTETRSLVIVSIFLYLCLLLLICTESTAASQISSNINLCTGIKRNNLILAQNKNLLIINDKVYVTKLAPDHYPRGKIFKYGSGIKDKVNWRQIDWDATEWREGEGLGQKCYHRNWLPPVITTSPLIR